MQSEQKTPEQYLCPRCGGLIPSNAQWGEYPGAISRHLFEHIGGNFLDSSNDRYLEVCSDCGVEEAIIDYTHDQTPVDIYPILTEHAINRRFEAIITIEKFYTAKSLGKTQITRRLRRNKPERN